MASVMNDYEEEIAERVERGETYENISRFLQHVLPHSRGLSPRSVRRFCSERGIRFRSGLNDSELDEVVSARVRAVGDSYGRRTLHGLLHSEGIHVSQRRIAASLRRTHPHELASRTQSMAQHINPVPYVAHCFGDKLHVDQNEKLNMYGVIHIVAVDGYS